MTTILTILLLCSLFLLLVATARKRDPEADGTLGDHNEYAASAVIPGEEKR